jgi:hypothetical protein
MGALGELVGALGGALGGGVGGTTDTGLSVSSLGVLPGSDGPKTGLRVSLSLFSGTGITNTGLLGKGAGAFRGALGTPVDGVLVGLRDVPSRKKFDRGSASIPFSSGLRALRSPATIVMTAIISRIATAKAHARYL